MPWILFLSALVLIPSVATAAGQPGPGLHWEAAGNVAWVSRDVVLLLGTIVTYLNWRMTASPTLGWYVATLAAVSLHFLTFDVLALANDPAAPRLAQSDLPDVMVLLAVPVLVLLAVRATPVPARLNPLGLGVAVAIASGGLRLLQLHDAAKVRRVQVEHPWVLVGTMAVIGVVSCVLMASAWTLPVWARRSSTLAGMVLLVAHIGQSLAPGDAAAALLAVVGTIGAMTVTVCTLRLCVETASTVQASSSLLGDRIIQAEQLMLHDREVLHELRSTLAGVNKASGLMRSADAVLPRSHRAQLQEMVEHELARMERLLDDRPIRERQLVELDDLIEPLVVAQRALGFTVEWEPSGVKVVAAPDDIEEAVHILLTNAARHASRATATISVTEDGAGGVLLRVSDTGPGIDRSVASHLFERGVHARSSPGEGIGLHVARRLVHDSGGALRVETHQDQGGSTFLLLLPALQQERQESAS